MKQKFRDTSLNPKSLARLDLINSILEDYDSQGYRLTLRQVYYQLVSRDIIPNRQNEYNKISRLLTEGRMAGLVDWDFIEDRLRQVDKPTTWNSPKSILRAAMNQFAYNRLKGQDTYVEVWVEKDALSQIVARSAHKYQVPVLVNRGYGSVSAIYNAYERFRDELYDHEEAVIFYLGDHDPSGLDMIRDIQSRLREMLAYDDMDSQLEVKPIALTMDQIEHYQPPENPAKLTDTRAPDYVAEHGYSSWEVDALEPSVLDEVITDSIESVIDVEMYEEIEEKEADVKERMGKLIDDFNEDEEE